MIQLCTDLDEFILDKNCWYCVLNNGVTVYQDDYRPDVAPEKAWTRLKDYLLDNKDVYIQELWLKFRSHKERIFGYAKAYYLGYGIDAEMFSGYRNHYYIVGQDLEGNGVFNTQKWSFPALLYNTDYSDQKVLTKDDPRVIINNGQIPILKE